MSTTDPHLLLLLKDKEVQERDRRHARAAEMRQRLVHVQAQSEQLTAYRRHYQDHWQLQFREGASPQVLQCYRQFVERLDAALAQQAHTQRHVLGLVEQAEQEALQQEIRVASIDKLRQRRAQQVEVIERRTQQRHDDEWAQRAARQIVPAMAILGA